MTEEVSGTGYQRRPIKWAIVEGGKALTFDWERAEAEEILRVLRKFYGLVEGEDENDPSHPEG